MIPTDGRPALCARDRDDAVRDVFCAAGPPVIRSLPDLQQVLGIHFRNVADPDAAGLGDTKVAALGHSTALSGHRVSPINPRLIIMGRSVLMAYQRGVQKAEVIAGERGRDSLNFYLIRFEQACNRRPDGCSPGAFKRGEQLALPYLEPRAVDVEKQAQLSCGRTLFRVSPSRAWYVRPSSVWPAVVAACPRMTSSGPAAWLLGVGSSFVGAVVAPSFRQT